MDNAQAVDLAPSSPFPSLVQLHRHLRLAESGVLETQLALTPSVLGRHSSAPEDASSRLSLPFSDGDSSSPARGSAKEADGRPRRGHHRRASTTLGQTLHARRAPALSLQLAPGRPSGEGPSSGWEVTLTPPPPFPLEHTHCSLTRPGPLNAVELDVEMRAVALGQVQVERLTSPSR